MSAPAIYLASKSTRREALLRQLGVEYTLLRLREASRTRAFWLLAGGFFVCGWSTNGLVGTHFVPAAHDHGLPTTSAAALLAACGSDSAETDTSQTPAVTTGDTSAGAGTTAPGGAGGAVVAGEAFPADRCAANQAAGTIGYLTGFDFAATASIIDIPIRSFALPPIGSRGRPAPKPGP